MAARPQASDLHVPLGHCGFSWLGEKAQGVVPLGHTPYSWWTCETESSHPVPSSTFDGKQRALGSVPRIVLRIHCAIFGTDIRSAAARQQRLQI
eukprot:3077422-Rhodomonas_salina.3